MTNPEALGPIDPAYIEQGLHDAEMFANGEQAESGESLFGLENLTPPGWTLLRHGTSTERWPDQDMEKTDSFELTSPMSAVTNEEFLRDAQDGMSTVSNYSRGEGESFEIAVVFPAEDLSSRLGTLDTSKPLQERIDSTTQDLVDKVYYKNSQRGRHPLLPKGEVMTKIGQDYDTENERPIYYYVPESVADLYAEQISEERGRIEAVGALALESSEILSEDEPDFVEKLSMTPVDMQTMSGLLAELQTAYDDSGSSNEALARREFIGRMQNALGEAMAAYESGDSITFDDLSYIAEAQTGMHDRLETIVQNPNSFVADTKLMTETQEQFSRIFDSHSELQHITDNIDDFTIHSQVHKYQSERIKANPNIDYFGYEHGADGRWVPEKRNGVTIWKTNNGGGVATEVAPMQPTNEATVETGTYNAAQETQPDPSTKEAAEELPLDQIPDDPRERILYSKETFIGQYSESKIPLLAAFLQKELAHKAEQVPEGSRYLDNIASVIGNGGDTWHYLREYVARKSGQRFENPNDFSRLAFSDVAQELGIDVRQIVPDFDTKFRSTK